MTARLTFSNLKPCAQLRWLMRAQPTDYLLALSVALASLPVIGERLEPVGGVTAMGIWGSRVVPHMAATSFRSWMTPGITKVRRQQRDQTHTVSDAGLRGVVAPADLDIVWPRPERTPPLCKALHHRRHIYREAVPYGDDLAQVLDVWRRDDLPAEPAPVVIFVPGGGWVHGRRIMQGYALMAHLAEHGWICLSIDYRTAPHHRWPQHLIDVKTAIAWARAHVDSFGGDRDFVCIAGCSAGGHLAALCALTPNDPELEAYLNEGADTSVDAVVGIYGRYDWEDRSTPERAQFVDFLEKLVVKRSHRRHRNVFRKASPIARVHSDAPPFLLIHGTADNVIPVEQARAFVERLRSASHSAVSYIELPGAGHGFDLIDGARTGSAATAVRLFLNAIHRNQTVERSNVVI